MTRAAPTPCRGAPSSRRRKDNPARRLKRVRVDWGGGSIGFRLRLPAGYWLSPRPAVPRRRLFLFSGLVGPRWTSQRPAAARKTAPKIDYPTLDTLWCIPEHRGAFQSTAVHPSSPWGAGQAPLYVYACVRVCAQCVQCHPIPCSASWCPPLHACIPATPVAPRLTQRLTFVLVASDCRGKCSCPRGVLSALSLSLSVMISQTQSSQAGICDTGTVYSESPRPALGTYRALRLSGVSETNIFLPFFMSKCGGSEQVPPHFDFEQVPPHFDIKNGRKILVSEKNGHHPLDSARRAEQLSF